MDLEEFRAFLAVADTGSLVSAAKLLHMSRPTLRRRVDQLEARAGVPLLERSRQGATLTSAGELLAVRGRALVQEASALVSSVRMVGSEPAGVLRVLLPCGMPPHLLKALFGFAHARFPRIAFDLRLSDDPFRELLVDVDLAFHFGSSCPDGPWISRQLLRVPMHLVASADYLERRGTPTTAEELGEHDLLSWAGPGLDGRRWPLREGGAVAVAPMVLARDIHLVRQLALAGHGIAFAPDAGLPDPGVERGALRRVLPDIVGADIAVRVIVPSALVDVPRVRAFLELLRPFLGEHGL